MQDLEVTCSQCNGTGKLKHSTYEYKCYHCNGNGLTLTVKGEELISFIKRWIDLQEYIDNHYESCHRNHADY